MKKQSRLVFFIKKIGKQAYNPTEKEKGSLKIAQQATKSSNGINISNNNLSISYSRRQTNEDNRVDSVNNNSNETQRMLDTLPKTVHNQIERVDVIRKLMKSAMKKCPSDQPIEEEDRSESRNKLFKIPIGANKLRQKCDKNLVSLVKIPNLSQQIPMNSTQNFNSFPQFKQFMSKLSEESQKSIESKKMAIIVNKNRKCSIIPALKPNICKQNSKSYHQPDISIARFEQYMQTKIAKRRLQKSLIIKSKKQELATHMISKFKTNQHNNKQQKMFKTLDNETKQQKQVNKKSSYSPDHSYRKKNERYSTFFSNNRSEEGVYQQKMRIYRQFLFIVNLAHRFFDPLKIIDTKTMKNEKITINRPTYYVGRGNNSSLLRSLMKRRIWWDQVDQCDKANFVWTQLKIKTIFLSQKSSQNNIFEIQNNKPKQTKQMIKGFRIKTQRQKQKDLQQKFLRIKNISSLGTLNPIIQQQTLKPGNLGTKSINIPKGLTYRAPFSVNHYQKLLTQQGLNLYKKIRQKCIYEEYQQRIKLFPKEYLHMKQSIQTIKVHNHLQFNHYLGNKKSLFYHLRFYYGLTHKQIQNTVPTTFHIKFGQNDIQFKKFLEQYQRISKEEKNMKNIWILKPGQNSNRGCGISVFRQLKQLKKVLRKKEKHANGELKTFIVQKYIERPLLYCGRKFDIRHYLIISALHGRLRAYFYGQGYIKTSSYIFDLSKLNDTLIHLTNDAVQKESEDYGCHQQGNKISYNQLQKYFTKEMPQINFDFDFIFGKMRDLAIDVVLSTYYSLDPNNRLHNFEVFGLDFMIDRELNVMLIEVNTNPCLQISSNLLSRIIPSMLQQTLRVTLDPLFPPTYHYSNNTKHLIPDCSLQKLQMELIFDSGRDGQELSNLYKANQTKYDEMIALLQGTQEQVEDVYDNEGIQISCQALIE